MRAHLEKVVPAPDTSFLAVTLEKPRFDRLWHYHPEVEIVLIEESEGQRFVGDDISAFKPGDLVLFGTNLPHVFRSEANAMGKMPSRIKAILVQFLPELFGNSFFTMPELANIQELLKRAARGLCFPGAVVAPASKLLRELVKSTGWRRVTLLIELLSLLAADRGAVPLSSPGFTKVSDQKATDRIGRAMQFIFENSSRPITLAEVAAEACMTPWAFCRFFHKNTNRHLSKFINEVRLTTACRLLRETEREVNEISSESGFGTLSNFNRFFKEQKGMTPREYRKLRV